MTELIYTLPTMNRRPLLTNKLDATLQTKNEAEVDPKKRIADMELYSE